MSVIAPAAPWRNELAVSASWRELHLAIAVKTVKKTDGMSYVKFGPDVPPVIVTARLVQAGSHRGDPTIEMVTEAKSERLCNGVIVDRGYTQSAPERFHFPLQRLGVAIFTKLKEQQRGEKPGIGPARLIDGALFCDSLPDDLVRPPMPPMGGPLPFFSFRVLLLGFLGVVRRARLAVVVDLGGLAAEPPAALHLDAVDGEVGFASHRRHHLVGDGRKKEPTLEPGPVTGDQLAGVCVEHLGSGVQ
jgi:hypothetical protein